MTNKPTDAEIIKALEKELKYVLDLQHRLEAFGEETPENDKFIALMSNTLHLINRLKAENEALQKHISKTEKKYAFAVADREANVIGFIETINKIKAEAIKEFAERLTNKADLINVNYFESKWAISDNDIDDLIEEMVGENQ